MTIATITDKERFQEENRYDGTYLHGELESIAGHDIFSFSDH